MRYDLVLAISRSTSRLLVLFDPSLLRLSLGDDNETQQPVGHDQSVLVLTDSLESRSLGDHVPQCQAPTDLEQLFQVGLGVDDEVVAIILPRLVPFSP